MPRRRLAAAVSAVVLAASVTACGPAPWQQPTEAPSVPASPAVTVAPPVPNDLASGSLERDLQAGAVSADLTYWSTLSMDQWLAGAVKPVSLSLVTQVEPDDGQRVYLQRAAMTVVPANSTDVFEPLTDQVDAATVAPGYLVLDPYSYSQTFNIGPVHEEATFVTLQFAFDFLVETEPESDEYAKHTATDTLVVAIAQREQPEAP